MFLDSVLTVDPGFSTGWAWWIGTDHPETGLLSTLATKTDAVSRVGILCREFASLVGDLLPSRILIEDQWFSEMSLVSHTSAKTGALKKLTWITGAYIGVCANFNIQPELIMPMSWKGNMDDGAVKRRVELITGVRYASSHVADAVGIGLNAVGRFIKVQRVLK